MHRSDEKGRRVEATNCVLVLGGVLQMSLDDTLATGDDSECWKTLLAFLPNKIPCCEKKGLKGKRTKNVIRRGVVRGQNDTLPSSPKCILIIFPDF